MNCKELKKQLIANRIPESYYCINDSSYEEMKYILRKSGDLWEVYYCERGEKTMNVFPDEDTACNYLLDRLILIRGMKPVGKPFLPLGSVVLLKGGKRKMFIVSRALQIRNGDQTVFFDYGAVPFPLGVVDEKMAYFQHESIQHIYHLGYTDAEDVATMDRVIEMIEANNNLVRGNTENWKK